jgi:hypothetical protein
MRKMRNGYNILARKPKGKGMLGRQMYRRDDNIKMDLIQIRSKDMELL